MASIAAASTAVIRAEGMRREERSRLGGEASSEGGIWFAGMLSIE
jgi:hypothetical protein